MPTYEYICQKCGKIFTLKIKKRYGDIKCMQCIIKAKSKKWYTKHADEQKERIKKWQKDNPEKVKLQRHKYYQHKKERFKIYSSERHKELKELKLCIYCKQPTIEGKILCENCTKKQSSRNSARFRNLQRTGRCTICGGEPLPGRKRCKTCADYQRISQQLYREKKRRMNEDGNSENNDGER
jgi:DNA-directed RNA polymerase subunit RPC12/RpoP